MSESVKAQESRSSTEPNTPAPPPYPAAIPRGLILSPPAPTHHLLNIPPSPNPVGPSLQPPFVPTLPFPGLMTAYYIYDLSIETFKYFRLCSGTDKTDNK